MSAADDTVCIIIKGDGEYDAYSETPIAVLSIGQMAEAEAWAERSNQVIAENNERARLLGKYSDDRRFNVYECAAKMPPDIQPAYLQEIEQKRAAAEAEERAQLAALLSKYGQPKET